MAIELKRQIQQGAEYLEVNDVRSFHGREFKNIVEPIANNKTLKWVDKEKGLTYLSSASQYVQQEIDKQDLDTATKVVKDFVNPKVSDENVADGGIMFRDGDMGLEETITKMKVQVSQAAQKATENLNLGSRVVVYESVEGLEGKEATAKGWYDTKTGQIHVVLSNNTDAADVTQTILHEAVAHHGLRDLFGHNVMDAFLDSVLAAASQEVKDAINELRRENGWNFRTATEEYLAGLVERTDFERMTTEERGLFATIRRLFNHALEFLGLKNHELSDRELAYILWCIYQVGCSKSLQNPTHFLPIVFMRLTTKLGERFSTVHSLIWRCLPSSSLSLNSKLIRLSLSDKWRRRGIMRMMGVTPASLSSDILLFTTPNNDSTGSELALCGSPSLTKASSRST